MVNRRQIVPPEFTGRIAPTRLKGINRQDVFASRRALWRAAPVVTSWRENKGQRMISTRDWRALGGRERGNRNSRRDKDLRQTTRQNAHQCSGAEASLFALKPRGPQSGRST